MTTSRRQPAQETLSRAVFPPRVWLIAFSTALALYVATAGRTVQWQDSGWQQWRIVSGEITHTAGLALTHPLQYYLGRFSLRLLPFLEPAHAITLVSALAGAIAVANLAALAWMLTRRASATFVCAASFGLAHTVWQFATHTESYALVNALLTAEWLGLLMFARGNRPAWLLLTFAANGLGVANHPLALLATPMDVAVLAITVTRRRATAALALAACAVWLLGASPYWTLIVQQAAHSGDVAATLHSALFGKYASAVLNTGFAPKDLALSAAFVVYNFPNLALPLAAVGLVLIRRMPATPAMLRIVWWTELALYALFVLRYSIPDRYTFFGPAYALLALFAGVGLHILLSGSLPLRRPLAIATMLTAIWNPLVYAAAARTLESRNALSELVGNKPYRNGYRTFLIPWGVGDDSAARAVRDTLAAAGENGVVLLQPNMIKHAFLYERALGRVPPAVTYIWVGRDGLDPDRHAQALAAWRAGRPIVLIPEDRDRPIAPLPGARWERRGDVYVAVAATPASSGDGSP
ncbi:MAG: DUF2723 domain-containing protein [Planctomycetota bacterium]|nr:MAG: DUF2723 domain-containing protein [Planctomycetota bacterium]